MNEEDEEFDGFCSREDVLKQDCFHCDIPEQYCLGLDTYEQCKKNYEDCVSKPADTSCPLSPMQRKILLVLLDEFDMSADSIAGAITERNQGQDTKISSVQRALTELRDKGLVWAKDEYRTYYWNIRDDNIDAVEELLEWNGENS